MIFEECALPTMRFFSKLPETRRGVGSFGSTNKTAKNAHVIPDDDDNQPTPTTVKPVKGVHVIPEEPPSITNTVPNCLSQLPPPIQAIDKPTSTEPE
eukprot:8882860-Ditylum_brightwellii.AAC.1